MNSAVKINRNTEIFTATLTDGGNTFKNGVDFIVTVYHLEFFGSVHLYCRKAVNLSLFCGITNIGGSVSAYPRIHLHLIAAFAAHQNVSRYTEGLTLNVPKCLVNA